MHSSAFILYLVHVYVHVPVVGKAPQSHKCAKCVEYN